MLILGLKENLYSKRLVCRSEGVALDDDRLLLRFAHGVAGLEDDGNDNLLVGLVLMLFGRFVGGGDDSLVIGGGTDVKTSGGIDDSVPDGEENNAGSFRGGNVDVANRGVCAHVLVITGNLGATALATNGEGYASESQGRIVHQK